MTGSVVSNLIDAMVAKFTTALPGVDVFDGFGFTNSDHDFVIVGADTLGDNELQSATASQTPGPFGTNRPRDENGSINLIAASHNGSANLKAARDAAYALTHAIETACRSNPTFGVSGVLWTGFGPDSVLHQIQDDNGAMASIEFSISFRSRI